MESNEVVLFTRNGLGEGPDELRLVLAGKYLGLLSESGNLPAKMLFYTDGVRLACKGSPVLELLKMLQRKGVELVLCKTCLDHLHLTSTVEVGIVGGMPDIMEALQKAGKVLSL